ncbi:MAG: prepilin peptidase [Anaerovoracaceae bacterium]|jgi:prepilin signal peptidase PulO-like enzyme (type II secretory pathway)
MIDVIKVIFMVGLGVAAGLTTVYFFNRIPAKWLCDYDEAPGEEMWGERISNRPWTPVFVLVFAAAGVKLLEQGILYGIPSIIALWLLLQIAIGDKKYGIIPDQFIVALGVTGIGFVPMQTTWLSPLLGALIGGGSLFFIGLIGKLVTKMDAMGFGDVKLFAVLGLIFGLKGTVIVLFLTFISSGLVFAVLLLAGRVKREEEKAFGPFICASAALYLLFEQYLTPYGIL